MADSELATHPAPKYAVGEYERRFLLDEIPPGATNPRHITDHYLDGTRLRLRTVREGAGSAASVDHKLGHKRRIAADDPTAILHTSMYLDAAEFDVLATLPGRRLIKTRWSVPVGPDADPSSISGSINVFGEELAGLILLEVDLASHALREDFTPPAWVGPEVTHDETFTGGSLAGATFADLAPVIAAAW